MRGYSAQKVFSEGDLKLREEVQRYVELLPESDEEGRTIRCHELARAVGARFGMRVVDGRYDGHFEHSWCITPDGHILDPYAIGREPIVQLVAAIPWLHGSPVPPYETGWAPRQRDDIRWDVVGFLVKIGKS